MKHPAHSTFEAALGTGNLVAVEGIPVLMRGLPDDWKTQRKIRLDFGLNLPRPIRDFDFNDDVLRGTLSFSGVPHHVVIPWGAIIAIHDGYHVGYAFGPSEPPDGLWAKYAEEVPGKGMPKPAAPVPEVKAKRERPSWMKVIK